MLSSISPWLHGSRLLVSPDYLLPSLNQYHPTTAIASGSYEGQRQPDCAVIGLARSVYTTLDASLAAQGMLSKLADV